MNKPTIWLALLIGAGAYNLAEAATGLMAASPGGDREVELVAARCPTFSWGTVSDAEAYELAVFRFSETELRSELVQPPPLERLQIAIRQTIRGNALAWTPPVPKCLKPGQTYGWSVRALGRKGASEWSEAKVFRISSAAADAESGDLAHRRRATPGGSIANQVQAATPTRVDTTGSTSLSRTEAPVPFGSLSAASAAISGELSTLTGAAFGVVGVSNSPDGAGLGAENTAGGADLLLVGPSASAALTEAGIDVSSATGAVFEIRNSGAGAMTLKVDGIEVLTSATGGDITEVTTGTGLEGGGTSGSVEVSVAPDGITAAEIADGSIANADIQALAAIDAAKIADGSVSDSEYQHLDGATRDLQPQIDINATDITANEDAIQTNTGDITTNAAGIVNNAEGIQTNTGDITTNTAGVTSNTAAITSNDADIAANTAAIGANTGDITTNTTGITSNTAAITSNDTDIAANTSAIGTNTGNITTNTAGVTSNTAAITSNDTDIAANTAAITSNDTDITANTAAIGTNTGNITANAAGIVTNATSITGKVAKSGDSMTGDLAMGGNDLTGVASVSATGSNLTLSSDQDVVVNATSGSIELNASDTTINLNANSTVGGTLAVTEEDASSAGVTNVVTVAHETTGGAGGSGIGTGLLFKAQDDAGDIEDAGQIAAILTDASTTSETSALSFRVRDSGGALAEVMSVNGTGIVAATSFSGDGSNLTLGSGQVTTTAILDGTVALADIGVNGCADSEILKLNGGAWTCSLDESGSPGAHDHFGEFWTGIPPDKWGFAVENQSTAKAHFGIRGFTRSSDKGRGVWGEVNSSITEGENYGVYGISYSRNGQGVHGETPHGGTAASPAQNWGVLGVSRGNDGAGVKGVSNYANPSCVAAGTCVDPGDPIGVWGESFGENGRGVNGVVKLPNDSTDLTYAVFGWTESDGGYGGYFVNVGTDRTNGSGAGGTLLAANNGKPWQGDNIEEFSVSNAGDLAVTGSVTLADVLRLTPKTIAPASCAIGEIYADTSGALCFCAAPTPIWEKLNSTGTCV